MLPYSYMKPNYSERTVVKNCHVYATLLPIYETWLWNHWNLPSERTKGDTMKTQSVALLHRLASQTSITSSCLHTQTVIKHILSCLHLTRHSYISSYYQTYSSVCFNKDAGALSYTSIYTSALILKTNGEMCLIMGQLVHWSLRSYTIPDPNLSRTELLTVN